MLQNMVLPLLPIIQALLDIHPIPQLDGLALRRLDVIVLKRLLQRLLALRDALVVLPPRLVQVVLALRLLDLLARLQHQHQQVRRLDLEGFVVGNVDASQREQVLRPQQRVGQRLEGLVDARRCRFGPGFGLGRVHVRVGAGLKLQEFAAEGADVDGEVAGRGRTVGERFGEEVVVGLRGL